MTLRILTVIGTRPEATKLAPVVKELGAYKGEIESIICSTGQHREMLDQMFKLFRIQPDIELNIMEHQQTLSQAAARILDNLELVLNEVKPHWVLVQGDTTSVMAATLTAHYSQIKVAHIEAGLRTYDRRNPFPEEINRIVADHVSDLRFAPTERARSNLLREGISAESIFVTGNTAVDSLLDIAARPSPPGLAKFNLPDARHLLLVTAHRRENQGVPIQNICASLRELARRSDVHIVFPVHCNPEIWNPVHSLLADIPNISLIPPQDYLTMVHLMKRSRIILTDSGGIQEEAPSLGVPVLVLRQTTERPEAIEAGTARLVGTDANDIVAECKSLLHDNEKYAQMTSSHNPFGDGLAAQRIVATLREQSG